MFREEYLDQRTAPFDVIESPINDVRLNTPE